MCFFMFHVKHVRQFIKQKFQVSKKNKSANNVSRETFSQKNMYNLCTKKTGIAAAGLYKILYVCMFYICSGHFMPRRARASFKTEAVIFTRPAREALSFSSSTLI